MRRNGSKSFGNYGLIRTHNESLIVVAMRVSNEDGSSVGIHG
jgi:hypothetical protein